MQFMSGQRWRYLPREILPPPQKKKPGFRGVTLLPRGFNFRREKIILGLWLIWHFSSSQAGLLADRSIMWPPTTHKILIFDRFLG
jgi:hypothetical protein